MKYERPPYGDPSIETFRRISAFSPNGFVVPVVKDRPIPIRENFKLYPKREHQRIFNDSLNQTLTRTINTSVSTLIVLLAIFIFGGDSIRSFAFAMILGVIFGTCSSIFIAAPTAYLVMGRKIKEAPAAEATEETK